MMKLRSDTEGLRAQQTTLRFDIQDLEDKIRNENNLVNRYIQELREKVDELMKQAADKKATVNMPINLDFGKGTNKKLDEEAIMENLEKMRDFITAENKRVGDQLFKFHIDFSSQIREKLDKKELEEIESK